MAFRMFKKFKALVENLTGMMIKKPRIDNGLEFCESEFNEFCATEDIARHKTLVGKPQQNRGAEHINKTLLERARCMLSNANIRHHRGFLAKAISIICYLVNQTPHSFIEFKIPEEVWSGNPINYSILRVFGCSVFAHCQQ